MSYGGLYHGPLESVLCGHVGKVWEYVYRVARMALKMTVRCRMREGPLNCRCSISISTGPDALSRVSDSIALTTSPMDIMSSPGGMVST